MKPPITWDEFEKIEMIVGTVVRCEEFPKARKPAFKLWIDFGECGVLGSSAQLTVHYNPQILVGSQVVSIVNFPPKNIGGFVSECLVCGFQDEFGAVILARPDRPVPNGSRIF